MARTPRGQQTRDDILAAALREFAERGYQAVTVEEIAAAAGVTKGAVYHWFTDKDDLGRELQHQLYERMRASAAAAFTPGGDLLDDMSRAFQVWLAVVGDLGEARFFLRDAWVIPALDEGGRVDHEAAVELVESVLADAIARGELAHLDAEATARVLMGAWAEATLFVLRTGRRAEAVAVIERLVGALRPGPSAATTTVPSAIPQEANA